MNSSELMSKFIINYVERDRRDRWQELAKKEGAVYKKLSQIERHLNSECVHVTWGGGDFLLGFVKKYGPVWLWDFHRDNPIHLIRVEDVLGKVNQRSAFLAISEKSTNALYFNGDSDGWLCGGWK